MRHLWAGVALATALLAGCGGGGGSNTSGGSGDGGGVTNDFGPVSAQAVGGVATPVTMSGSSSTVTGVYGANFTNLTVNLTPNNAQTASSLDFQTDIPVSVSGKSSLYDLQTGNLFKVSLDGTSFANSSSPAMNPTGTQVICSEYDPISNLFQLYTENIDGSGRTQITHASDWCLSPSYSPNGAQITYTLSNDVIVSSYTGGSPVNITNTASTTEYDPRWSPDGTKIFFLRFNSSGGSQIWSASPTGANQKEILDMGSSEIFDFDIAPNGQEVFFSHQSGGGYGLFRFNMADGIGFDFVSSADSIGNVSLSPSGSLLAYQDLTSKQVLTYSFVQNTSTPLFSTASNGAILGEWGSLPRKKPFIAASGAIFNTNAAGFLYGMAGPTFTSILAFDATTRNTVAIDPSQAAGFSPSNFVATITAADKITMLRYVNSFAAPRITIVDPAVPAQDIQGALVSYDASTGRVASVVTLTRSRGQNKPAGQAKNGLVTYYGDFAGVYDVDGHKTAGNQTQVTFDPKTGKVVSTSNAPVMSLKV